MHYYAMRIKSASLYGCLFSLYTNKYHYEKKFTYHIRPTLRPRDTRPQAAQTLQVHVFEWGPKKFELNEFM